MKRHKVLIYVASACIPVLIFMLCALFNKYVPFDSELLNAYDSFTQYPGMLLEYAKLIRGGNIFYSWGAGLGFNFFGTITYYGMSPLNLFALFANSSNYHLFIAIMTFVRFGLLGLSMCFYLDHKKVKPIYIVLFSTAYALMGYTATYYYNYIWIDSIIMLPIVIYGLDKLIEGKSPAVYIFSLAFTIIINYYIGYMICLFSLIWFIYKSVTIENKKKLIKTFIISSLCAGAMSAVVLLPSMFALLAGKAELYSSVDYLGISENFITFFYTFTIGSYQMGDQINGPALVYSSILVFVLSLFYFFNKKFSKKEKLATFLVILFFYLSFSVNFLNYAWQFFQKPIWWQSRFSFIFTFFLISLAARTLMNIEEVDFKTKHRLIALGIIVAWIIVGAIVKFQSAHVTIQGYTYFFLGFSLMILVEMIFLLDKKGFMTMIMIVTFVELAVNTFNSLKSNYRYKSYTDYQYIKDEMPGIIEDLDRENEDFYRMEFIDEYSSNDGLYFGFNGFNYFNSARNIRVIHLMEQFGLSVADRCHVRLSDLDPVILSLFNIKYVFGEKAEYLEKKSKRIFENKYPLAIGFLADSNIKNLELDENNYGVLNRNSVIKTLTKTEEDFYKTVDVDKFKRGEDGYNATFKYNFISDGHYLLMFANFSGTVEVNGKDELIGVYKEIKKGDKVNIEYSIASAYEDEDVYIRLLDLDLYERTMSKLSENVLHAKTGTNGHILEGHIDVTGEFDYLYTSIEYENGMKVFVDGKEVKPDVILGTLIGIQLENGQHEVYIDYVPQGFKPGTIISLVGLVGTLVYLQMRKKTL